MPARESPPRKRGTIASFMIRCACASKARPQSAPSSMRARRSPGLTSSSMPLFESVPSGIFLPICHWLNQREANSSIVMPRAPWSAMLRTVTTTMGVSCCS